MELKMHSGIEGIPPMPDYATWLKKGLEKEGVTAETVALALNKAHSTVYKIIDGSRALKAHEIPIIAQAIQEPIPVSDNSIVIPVSRVVSADSWQKFKPIRSPSSIAIVRNDAVHIDGHTGFRVNGDCLPDAPVRHGDEIACTANYRGRISTGMLVIAERTQGASKVYTLRSVVMHGKRVGLGSISKLGKGSSVEFAGGDTTICAVALAVTRSLTNY